MKALNLFNAVMLALAVTLATTMGVVLLILSFYLDAAPRIRSDWTEVGKITLIFTALSLCAASAFWGQRRGAVWRWPAQGSLLAVLGVGGVLLAQLLA